MLNMNAVFGSHIRKRILVFLILHHVLHSICAQNYTNTTYTSSAPAVDDIPSSKPLKPWLIGVIVLSIIVAIGATITVIQRCRKRGQNFDDRYTIGDYE